MCIFRCIRRRKQSNSSQSGNQDSTTNQDSSATNVRQSTHSAPSFTCISSDDDYKPKPFSFKILNKAKKKEKNDAASGQKNQAFAEKKLCLEKAQKAMGIKPNGALMERYAMNSQRLDRTQEISENDAISRRGDISFSLPCEKEVLSKARASMDDDTERPKALNSEVVTDNEELHEENDRADEINENNYMYHDREILFTCHQILKNIDTIDIMGATGAADRVSVKDVCDPMAPPDELENRKPFDCMTLRLNTFISNSYVMPTPEEKAQFKQKKPQTAKQSFVQTVIALDKKGMKVPPMSPIYTRSMSCARTPDSAHMSQSQGSYRSIKSKRPAVEKKASPRGNSVMINPKDSSKGNSVRINPKDSSKANSVMMTPHVSSKGRSTMIATKDSIRERSTMTTLTGSPTEPSPNSAKRSNDNDN